MLTIHCRTILYIGNNSLYVLIKCLNAEKGNIWEPKQIYFICKPKQIYFIWKPKQIYFICKVFSFWLDNSIVELELTHYILKDIFYIWFWSSRLGVDAGLRIRWWRVRIPSGRDSLAIFTYWKQSPSITIAVKWMSPELETVRLSADDRITYTKRLKS